MNEHKKFEILCALVVVGQVSDADLLQLKRHIETCVDCQKRISDFAQISAQAMPLSGATYGKLRSPKAMTTRFVELARAQGISLREPQQLLPSDLSFGLLSWKGNVIAALLLIAIIAGISKSVLSRPQSADRAKDAKLQLPNERSIQTNIQQNPSMQRTKLLPVPRRTKISSTRFVESACPRRPSSERESHYLGPGQVLPNIQYSANHYQGKTAFHSQLFLSDGKSDHPSLFEAYERSSGRPWQVAPTLMPFRERNRLVNTADYVGTDPKEHTATSSITSLNLPFHVFSFGSGRPLLSDSPRTQSELNPNIDWYQVWLNTRTELLRNSNDPSQYHPGLLAPGWPFSKESKGDQ
jgi:hypothetical protein